MNFDAAAETTLVLKFTAMRILAATIMVAVTIITALGVGGEAGIAANVLLVLFS